ncbi:hypothetical protein BDY19DRAFT_996870 [Irpex rosettiformis]|uniref:Uncharacterized protein n=1 Tax=Irpex rosettiformis TaxID=378272 RepID=A0ACB8TTM1_9APHY|nr:hypothetical protein BDY19DRAFT_996870 [Irpex rosettiformis]
MSRFVRASKYWYVFSLLAIASRRMLIVDIDDTSCVWARSMALRTPRLPTTHGTRTTSLPSPVNWNASGGGAFTVLPFPSPFNPLSHGFPFKVPDATPPACGRTAPVLDTD